MEGLTRFTVLWVWTRVGVGFNFTTSSSVIGYWLPLLQRLFLVWGKARQAQKNIEPLPGQNHCLNKQGCTHPSFRPWGPPAVPCILTIPELAHPIEFVNLSSSPQMNQVNQFRATIKCKHLWFHEDRFDNNCFKLQTEGQAYTTTVQKQTTKTSHNIHRHF